MRRRHLESVSAALYGSTFQHLLKSPIRIQPQLSGKGVLGHSPKCVLPTFAHTKVGPRRAGVQAVTLRRLRYADRRPQTIPCRVGIQILISKRPRPAARRLPTWSRISSAAHSSANRSPRARAPRPLSSPKYHNNSQPHFPNKAHYLCNSCPIIPSSVNFPLNKVNY